jgi:REP element-mobilizing transposase RayT
LPHIYPQNAWLFVTWHLHGSLPRALYPPPNAASAGQAFVWMDRYLDTTRIGPMYLMRPEAARLIVEALQEGAAMGMYELRAFVVMSNHVHVLLRAAQPPRALQWLKGTTARECNQLLDRTGQPFWQRESYDHVVRDEREFQNIVAYIENNPVKAGLVAAPELYQWSSANVAHTSARRRGLQSTIMRTAN